MKLLNRQLNTLEKRELHIPNELIEQIIQGQLLLEDLYYIDDITGSQDLDDLEFVVDTNQLLLESVGPGTVGLPVSPSRVVGRKSTGDILAMSPSDVLNMLPTSDPLIVGEWWNNLGTITQSIG